LEKKIDSTEKVLDNKLQSLDQDKDGELNILELKDAVQSILKHPTETEAAALVELLDKDKDGVVSVVELLQYAVTRNANKQVEKG